jgi:predicted metal-dependent hydrolase
MFSNEAAKGLRCTTSSECYKVEGDFQFGTGRLTLNFELLEMPKLLGEFVIVHEVVHIIAPNHGKVFKSFMFAYLPDWQERERRLRDLERAKMLSKLPEKIQ